MKKQLLRCISLCLMMLLTMVTRVMALSDEPVTATFPFNLGTEGQVAVFGDADSYFLGSKVTHGEGLWIKDKNNQAGFDETRFEPYSKNSNADVTNEIRFIIQPKPGYTFTPTSVALKATRFGTDNGKINVAWLNADGTTMTLATAVRPNRNNGTNPANADEEGMKYSDLSYTVTGATPGEGACGLVVNLYDLQDGKQIGFADIVINGVLSGEEKDMPILASFKANGEEYLAEDIFTASGDHYEGTIELSKTATMISATNPLTDLLASNGEIGTVTYVGDETQCVVTIPMTAGDVSLDYVLRVVQKPDFMLTYYNTDNTVMGTQFVEKDAAIGEFAVDYTTSTAQEGYMVRGWFVTPKGGRKYHVDDVITADTKLYAVATEIEVASSFKKYSFPLNDEYFYPEDHEAFNPVGTGSFHDKQHGWVFSNGDQIELLVGTKANIFISLCRYSKDDAQIVVKDADGNILGSVAGYDTTDGNIVTYQHEGASGKIVLHIESSGAVYIHQLRIVNTEMTNYSVNGQWYSVYPGDVSSLVDAIDGVNGTNASKDAERAFIFIPNGTYDLGYTVLTTLSGNNVSLIGESQEGVIIRNAPLKEDEGIDKAATLLVTGQNTYIQDLTIQNALDYYGALADGLVGGRATCLWDKGTNTICKNVTLLSYQDTYCSNNNNMKAYWEDCDIHGTVDFICGGGDVRFQNTTISLEKRNANGTGGRTITAPTTTTNYGYVFDNCRVVDLAEGKGNWNFGRTWQNDPVCVFLNTTLDNYAKNTLVAKRWTEKGMNNRDPKLFGEYGTMDENGNDITPASNVITSYGGTFETILTAEQAANFAYEKMFIDWDPASIATQMPAPANARRLVSKLVWDPVEGATKYLLEMNGQFLALLDGAGDTGYNLNYWTDTSNPDAIYTVRAANAHGGFGEKAEMTASTGIDTIDAEVIKTEFFSVDGKQLNAPQLGLNIVVKTTADGRKLTEKVIVE